MPLLHMEWNPSKFKILGIWFTNDLKNCELLNFKENFSYEIKAVYETCIKRQITSLGREAISKITDVVKDYSSMDFTTKATRQPF